MGAPPMRLHDRLGHARPDVCRAAIGAFATRGRIGRRPGRGLIFGTRGEARGVGHRPSPPRYQGDMKHGTIVGQPGQPLQFTNVVDVDDGGAKESPVLGAMGEALPAYRCKRRGFRTEFQINPAAFECRQQIDPVLQPLFQV